MSDQSSSDLVRLAEAIAWLDERRWTGRQPDNVPLRMAADASPTDRVLAHWITYMTDRMRRWEDVWHYGAWVFSRVATDFARERPTADQIVGFLEGYRRDDASGKMRGWTLSAAHEVVYKARFPDDDASIYRTLRMLVKFDWSLVKFLNDAVAQVSHRPDGLRRVAHRLDLLSYRLSIANADAARLLGDSVLSEGDYEIWVRTATESKKRLWAALRDLRKPGTRWNVYLAKSGFKWPDDHFELTQLELPGDVWNTRFFHKLVAPLAARSGVAPTGSSAVVARRIYDAVQREDPSTKFHPEQFDVSFDFGQRMCDAMACWYCPFWKRAGEVVESPASLCVRSEGQPCGLLLLTTGYLADCDATGCPLCRGGVAGMCDGVIDHVETRPH